MFSPLHCVRIAHMSTRLRRALVAAVEKEKGERWSAFRDRYGDWGRDVALMLGRLECGLKLGELGELCGGMDYRSVGTAVMKMRKRVREDEEAKGIYERIRETLQS